MICNVSKTDRAVRVLLAVVILGAALYFVPAATPKTFLLTAAVLLLLSAWFGFCYFYKLFGISTAPRKAPQPESN